MADDFVNRGTIESHHIESEETSSIDVGIGTAAQLTSVSGKERKEDEAITKEATPPTVSGASGSVCFGTNPSTARFFAASAMGM
jgi:hypothetical protein